MNAAIDYRAIVRDWIASNNPELGPEKITYDSELIEQRLLTSLQLMELLLLLEQLKDAPIPIDSINPGTFRTINTIINTLLEAKRDDRDQRCQ